MSRFARRGEVWYVDFDPVQGHEQAGRRPALIMSVDAFNATPAELVTVVPITSKARALRSRIQVTAPEGGLARTSYLICEQVRTISTRRLVSAIGMVSETTMTNVSDIVRMQLGL
jgi:mRNA interferase MazF